MALVVGILEPADYGLGRLDFLGELLLGEPCSGSKLGDLPGDFGVGALLLDRGLPSGIFPNIAPQQNRACIRGLFLVVHLRQSTRLLESHHRIIAMRVKEWPPAAADVQFYYDHRAHWITR
jgi:hypothetical protein